MEFFDLQQIEAKNIAMIRDRTTYMRSTGRTDGFDLRPYLTDGGQINTDIAGRTMGRNAAGIAQLIPDYHRVAMIVLTKKYLSAQATLQYYEDSILLPPDVVDAVRELDTTVQADINILQQILDTTLQENPDLFFDPYFPVIAKRFAHQVIPLKPKVDRIIDASRAYLKTGNARPVNSIALSTNGNRVMLIATLIYAGFVFATPVAVLIISFFLRD